MNKRDFLKTSLAGVIFTTFDISNGRALDDPASVTIDDVVFSWRHNQGRIFANIEAPTRGWVAAGFNAEDSLRNTRFVIGRVVGSKVEAQEHLALVPNHQPVESLGLASNLSHVGGEHREGVSYLSFSLPHIFTDGPTLDLAPRNQAFLMLAWSHHTDFNHHSAWRQHRLISL